MSPRLPANPTPPGCFRPPSDRLVSIPTKPTGFPRACCAIGANQIPIAPTEPGALCPALSFPGGFRTPALGARGGINIGPASETHHTTHHTSGLSAPDQSFRLHLRRRG